MTYENLIYTVADRVATISPIMPKPRQPHPMILK